MVHLETGEEEGEEEEKGRRRGRRKKMKIVRLQTDEEDEDR